MDEYENVHIAKKAFHWMVNNLNHEGAPSSHKCDLTLPTRFSASRDDSDKIWSDRSVQSVRETLIWSKLHLVSFFRVEVQLTPDNPHWRHGTTIPPRFLRLFRLGSFVLTSCFNKKNTQTTQASCIHRNSVPSLVSS